MEIVGHRGLTSPTTPENSVASMVAALDAGAHGVEVDVRLTADRVAVCVHDSDLLRVAGLAVLVEQTSFKQLRRIELAGGQTVPTLREVTAAVAGRGRLVVDVKSDPRTATLARKVLQGVEGMPERDLVISSRDPQLLLEVGQRDATVARALIACGELERAATWAVGLGCEALHPELRSLLVSPSTVAETREVGLLLRVWTVNRSVDADLLARAGAVGILTDLPAAALLRRTVPAHGAPPQALLA